MIPLVAFSLLLCYCGSIRAAIFTNTKELQNSHYDFVIVGAGTAGSVLASRLSENPGISVLVVEAGGNSTTNDALSVPFFVAQAAPSTPFDWNYTTTPQVGFNNRSIPYPRGFVTGGSSSINYMFYTRGSSDDWDKFAKVTGDNGWTWNKMFPYFLKSERHVASSNDMSTSQEFNPKLHGTTGPVLTSLPGFPTVLDSRVLNTTKELAEFPFNLDMNSGNPLGIGWLQSTIGNGARSSAATGYLQPPISKRRNLDLLLNTHVVQIVRTGQNGNLPSFKAISVRSGDSGGTMQISANKEVIISAGAIGTPQLLMLSGIGDKKDLASLHINAQVDVPAVGKSMQDHPFVSLQWSVNSNQTFDSLNQNENLLTTATALYQANRTGPLVNNPGANHIGFFKLPKGNMALRGQDPSAGSNSPHFELTFGNSFLSFTQAPPSSGSYLSILIALVSPSSRGNLRLTSSSAFDHPKIDPAMLTSPSDISILVEGVKAAQRLVKSNAWKGYIIEPFVDSANLTSDTSIVEYIRKFASSFNHVSGTVAAGGALDSELKVKGVDGLRVVDASVLPFIFGAHLQAVVYGIAERSADLIKADHRLS